MLESQGAAFRHPVIVGSKVGDFMDDLDIFRSAVGYKWGLHSPIKYGPHTSCWLKFIIIEIDFRYISVRLGVYSNGWAVPVQPPNMNFLGAANRKLSAKSHFGTFRSNPVFTVGFAPTRRPVLNFASGSVRKLLTTHHYLALVQSHRFSCTWIFIHLCKSLWANFGGLLLPTL